MDITQVSVLELFHCRGQSVSASDVLAIHEFMSGTFLEFTSYHRISLAFSYNAMSPTNIQWIEVGLHVCIKVAILYLTHLTLYPDSQQKFVCKTVWQKCLTICKAPEVVIIHI